ncbi:MAG: hypothetical protein IJ091_06175 [Oscillospiraceae bacterium]|nr:hypothetical protein [Oscillospiraceae bacterium]
MKRVLVKSVYDAFDYVMSHYYPFGLEEFAERTDSYAVISIQDTHTKGFGFEFRENLFCDGVLTLYFDDIIREVEGAQLFTAKQADAVIDFICSHKKTETLLVHCYGGESRSRAVGAFAVKMLGGDNSRYFESGRPNEYVYNLLEERYASRKEKIDG